MLYLAFFFLPLVNVLISAPDVYRISVFTIMQTPSLLGNSRNKEMLYCIKIDLMASHIREFIKVLPSFLVWINKTSAWRVVFVSTALSHILGILFRGHPCCQEMLGQTKRLTSFFRLPARARRSKRGTLHSWRNFKKRRRNNMNMLKKLWPD